MSDIVDELRDQYPETILFTDIKHIAHEAAETIERLRDATLRLEGQLATTERLLAESQAREKSLFGGTKRDLMTKLEQQRDSNKKLHNKFDAAIAKAKREENEACAKVCDELSRTHKEATGECCSDCDFVAAWESASTAIRTRLADELKGGEQ